MQKTRRFCSDLGYEISKATGVDQGVLSKFVHGERGLSFESLDLLGEFLEIDLVVRKKNKRR